MLGPEFVVRDLTGYPELPDISETGSTFEENAILKAVAASEHVPGVILADDSGLEVDVLGGAPGIFSARYSGSGDDQQNVRKLLDELNRADPNKEHRQAKFRCVLAVARSGRVLRTFTGLAEGKVIETPRGMRGFGYDPVFVPEGLDQTFAELPQDTKNRLSHRARAVAEALPFLKTALRTS